MVWGKTNLSDLGFKNGFARDQGRLFIDIF